MALSKLEIVSDVLVGAMDKAKIANILNQNNFLATEGLITREL